MLYIVQLPNVQLEDIFTSSVLQLSRTIASLSRTSDLSLLFEKTKLTNHSNSEPENLHVRTSSKLVHRHRTYSLTLLLLVKQGPEIIMQAISMS